MPKIAKHGVQCAEVEESLLCDHVHEFLQLVDPVHDIAWWRIDAGITLIGDGQLVVLHERAAVGGVQNSRK
jgi:hypothetical protein